MCDEYKLRITYDFIYPQKYTTASELFRCVGRASNVTSTDQTQENRAQASTDGSGHVVQGRV
jgi:hypothetical protein